ncbi:MAG: hypothetical protein J5449_08715 [Oscillospiraceae bacterium]|nr:hypothetical protein [Oscillospiraceae bacterium]
MKESFYASACIDGLQGGAVYLTDDGFYFRSQKATIADEYRNLKIPYENIKAVSSGKRALFTPTTIIETNSGKTYRFLIFGREKFIDDISKKLTRAENTI